MSSATYSESGVKTNNLTVVRKKSKAGDIIHAAIVILLMLVFLAIPFWILIVTAGKTQAEAVVPSMALPSQWHLIDNIKEVIVEGKVFPALLGSLIVTVPSVFICLLFGSMAAWIFGRRTSKGTAMLYALFISGVILPPSVVTIMMLLKMIGLSGTAPGMICVYVGIYLSVVIFFITGFIRTIPPSLEEAARIDGASPMRIFFTIIFPLLAPTLASSTILVVLYIWNDIFYSLFILSGKMSTLPLNLYNVASAGLYLNNWHLIFAYIILMTLPLLIVFVIGQRKIISGITGGAVK
ncbi:MULTISPECIES: carbohydrate ABC transporter permease [Bifidobacterium]|uniref:Sugar ABC transporter permease n=2 Tax=Bifidobacterium TaxID=1678 RepID=A0A7Y0EZ30_9BIFI|nr:MULTISPECIES: carbohydrate ABC transporter permease [Bifidobacterium]MBW3090792.1 carbohydrate ABC transporter permease [Bifidobacterium miconisargentati]NMM99039.1 sugar ABC transporter permease [Bifidobacterium sp. DSM 109959]PWG62896.1 sugar ABC transporter permease [Bifidobacterium callitrichidarum]